MRFCSAFAALVLASSLSLVAAENSEGPLADLTFNEGATHALADFAGNVVVRVPVCRS